jgi:hypothetical protein
LAKQFVTYFHLARAPWPGMRAEQIVKCRIVQSDCYGLNGTLLEKCTSLCTRLLRRRAKHRRG